MSLKAASTAHAEPEYPVRNHTNRNAKGSSTCLKTNGVEMVGLAHVISPSRSIADTRGDSSVVFVTDIVSPKYRRKVRRALSQSRLQFSVIRRVCCAFLFKCWLAFPEHGSLDLHRDVSQAGCARWAYLCGWQSNGSVSRSSRQRSN